MQDSKQELRLLARKKLSQTTDEDRIRKSTLLSKNLFGFLKELKSIHDNFIVGAFAPLLDEADWFLELNDRGIVFAFPTLNESGQMVFLESRLEDLLITEVFKVKVRTPCKQNREVVPDILLIPGLGFTAVGDRLGRGKGFYDKYLEKFKGQKIGICFQEQIFESIPTERHDQFVDYVVTDGAVFRR